jgi:hypothetical protein
MLSVGRIVNFSIPSHRASLFEASNFHTHSGYDYIGFPLEVVKLLPFFIHFFYFSSLITPFESYQHIRF